MNSLTMLPVLVLSVAMLCSCEIFHIVPVNSTVIERCDEEPCLTLDQLARTTTNQNLTNLTLHFISGEHFLNQIPLGIKNMKSTKMIGPSLGATIKLVGTKLSISKVEDLVIENLIIVSYDKQTGHVLIKECQFLFFSGCTFNRIELNILIGTVDHALSNGSFKTTLLSKDLSITHCEFNYSSIQIFNADTNVTFQVSINDTNYYRGKGIEIDGVSASRTILYLTNCMFKYNYRGAVKFSTSERIIIINSTFAKNNYKLICQLQSIIVEIINCSFTTNTNCENVISTTAKQIYIANSQFSQNQCTATVNLVHNEFIETYGGIDTVHIENSSFLSNRGEKGGGVTNIEDKGQQLFITNCEFTTNHAHKSGGAIYSESQTTIIDSIFKNNIANKGGAIYFQSYFNVSNCIFTSNNNLRSTGAAVFKELGRQSSRTSVIKDTLFSSNTGSETVTILGSKIRMENTRFINNGLTLANNGTLMLRKNIRSCIYIFNCDMNVVGPVTISGNVGRSIHAIQSQILINSTGNTVISNNTASSGGGILLRESELVIQSPVIISNNKAEWFGGGIYAYQSTVDFTSIAENIKKSFIINNFAGQNGGGLHVIASTIKLTYSNVTIVSNTALLNGGGLYLLQSSKIYLLKHEEEEYGLPKVSLNIISNSALYGGGIYVADNSTAGDVQCQKVQNQRDDDIPSATPECFIQTIQLYVTGSRKRAHLAQGDQFSVYCPIRKNSFCAFKCTLKHKKLIFLTEVIAF